MGKDSFSYTMHLPAKVYHDFKECMDLYPAMRRRKDYYVLFLHVLTSQMRYRFRELRRIHGSAKEWFCSLSSVLLHQMLGNRYNEIISDLIALGFIWRSDSYVVGTEGNPGKCKAFAYRGVYAKYLFRYLVSREEYYGDDTGQSRKVGHTVKLNISDRYLLERMRTYMKNVKAAQMMDPMVHRCHDELENHFTIDAGMAKKTVAGMVRGGKMTERAARVEMDKVQRFNRAGDDSVNLYVKKDRYGRIHTNLTNIKKEIRRNCIKCDGEPVASVDIRSSQGAFLCAILGRFVGETSLFVSVDPYLDTVVDRCRWIDRKSIRFEYENYRKLLMSHSLYEFFAEELSNDLDIDREVGRNEAKKEFLAMLFAPISIDCAEHPVRGAVRRVWEEHFPHLLLCVDELKRESYASLAHLMQKIESSFVFERLVPDMIREVGCHFFTVHDEIVVPERYVDSVQQLADRELSQCGIPTATAEEYALVHPDEVMQEFYGMVSEELYGDGMAEDLVSG